MATRTTTELTELRRSIGQLRHCVEALRADFGDTSAVRRLANDVERLEIDAVDLAEAPTPPKPRVGDGGKPDVVVVPDTPYDRALWLDADDEGVGGVGRHGH
jgi:hypothetical protein